MDIINVSLLGKIILKLILIPKTWNIQLVIGKTLYLLILLSILVKIAYLLFKNKLGIKEIEIDEAELGIGNCKLKLKPNHEVAQIAYKLWVELNTRKIGLKIDPENDVIDEVYNSWYTFFGITRELIKTIPAHKLRKDESTRKLVDIATKVLNKEFRVHLTKWQAKFKYWYSFQKNRNQNPLFSPQQIQKQYPEFNALLLDMQDVNIKMIYYKSKLKEIFIGSIKPEETDPVTDLTTLED